VTSKTFLVSLMVEFIGTMMFTFLGSTVTDKVSRCCTLPTQPLLGAKRYWKRLGLTFSALCLALLARAVCIS
jgi:hypothetical protein